MLREILKVRQIPGEAPRRWFHDEGMDLFVWSAEDAPVIGFQLSYDKPHAEKAITWRREHGFAHSRVDEGTRPGQHPGSPLLLADGRFDAGRVREDFLGRAAGIDPTVCAAVADKLGEYAPAWTSPAPAPAESGPPVTRPASAADRWLVGAIAAGWAVLTALAILSA